LKLPLPPDGRLLERRHPGLRFHEAVKATAGVAPYLRAGDEYVEESRAAGGRKLTRLEQRAG